MGKSIESGPAETLLVGFVITFLFAFVLAACEKLPTDRELSIARHDGVISRKLGFPRTDNPYSHDREYRLWKSWDRGYDSTRR